jgi:hypothetical protein
MRFLRKVHAKFLKNKKPQIHKLKIIICEFAVIILFLLEEFNP